MNRIDEVRNKLAEFEIDALVVTPGPSFAYVSGHEFFVTDRFFALIVPAEADPVVILPSFDRSIWESEIDFAARVFGWEDTEGPSRAVRGPQRL